MWQVTRYNYYLEELIDLLQGMRHAVQQHPTDQQLVTLLRQVDAVVNKHVPSTSYTTSRKPEYLENVR